MLNSWHGSNDLRDPGCAHVITRVSPARDILAARENLNIATRVLSSCYCLNLELCQHQLRNLCWLRLLVIFLSTLRVRCLEQTTRTKF